MSKLIANTIRHTGGSADNITLDNSQNVTVEGNATVDGTSTLTGNVTCSGQLKTDAIRHTGASSDAITLASDGTAIANLSTHSRYNLIDNGEFAVNQRGNSTGSYGWCGDRFQNRTGSSTVITQTTTVPAGFSSAMQLAPSSGTATLQWNTLLEVGNNVTGTNIGNYYSANSKWTISIWATVAVSVKVNFCTDWGSGDAQEIQANTAMTSTGDTSNGFTRYKLTFDVASVTPHANNKGLQIHFSTSSAASEVKFTGAQLEEGEVAGPFNHLSYSEYLTRCQRYYENSYNDEAPGTNTSNGGFQMPAFSDNANNTFFHGSFVTSKRHVPTMTYYRDSGTSGQITYYRDGVNTTGASVSNHRGSRYGFNGYINCGAAWTSSIIIGHWVADSEL
jgi:hypothetical protein